MLIIHDIKEHTRCDLKSSCVCCKNTSERKCIGAISLKGLDVKDENCTPPHRCKPSLGTNIAVYLWYITPDTLSTQIPPLVYRRVRERTRGTSHLTAPEADSSAEQPIKTLMGR